MGKIGKKGYVAMNKDRKFFVTTFHSTSDINNAKVWYKKENIFRSWSGPSKEEFDVYEVAVSVTMVSYMP